MSAVSQIDVFVDRRFEDFDDMSEALNQWDLSVRQIDRGTFRGRLFNACIGEVLLAAAEYGRSMVQEGATPSTMRTFALLVSPESRFIWRRQEVTSDDLLIFPVSGELSCVTDQQFSVFAFSIPEEMLEEACERNHVTAPLSGLLRCEKVPSRSVPFLRRKLLDVVNSWWRLNPVQIIQWQTGVADVIVKILARDAATHYSPLTQLQDRALRQAEALIRQYPGEPLSVGDLCAAVNVSERTLRTAFVKYFGIAPAAYMIANRLNGVRHDLKAGQFRSIHDVASRWGFWHMGQFAADFRRHFGALPSQTLERFAC